MRDVETLAANSSLTLRRRYLCNIWEMLDEFHCSMKNIKQKLDTSSLRHSSLSSWSEKQEFVDFARNVVRKQLQVLDLIEKAERDKSVTKFYSTVVGSLSSSGDVAKAMSIPVEDIEGVPPPSLASTKFGAENENRAKIKNDAAVLEPNPSENTASLTADYIFEVFRHFIEARCHIIEHD